MKKLTISFVASLQKQLANGNWQLAIGNWQLAIGYWPLANSAEFLNTKLIAKC
jgi:hypothetical protein